MYTEVFASRLLWALGFVADRVYPTKEVVCFDCPVDPFSRPEVDFGSKISFPDASVEYPYSKIKVISESRIGWSFQEINRLRKGGHLSRKTRIEFEALVALMAILVHSSNLTNQQKMILEQKDSLKAKGYVHDLGSTLGSQYRFIGFSYSKSNLQDWRSFPLWEKESKCLFSLKFHDKSYFFSEKIRITESGKEFLVSRLKSLVADPQLGDKRLRYLFSVAKFMGADPKVISIDEWVEVFKEKVKSLQRGRCPDSLI